MMSKKRVSIVAPMYNESESVHYFFDSIEKEIAKASAYTFEIIIVNDGSKDDTIDKLYEIQKNNPKLGIVDFSRNFGHESAVAAGFEYATGDAVIIMDADLQDPPELIHELLRKWEEGYLVVNAKRGNRDKDPMLKRFTAAQFYNVINMFNEKVKIPKNVGNYRLMDRVVVDEINALPEKNRVFRVLVPFVGYKTGEVEFVRPERVAGETHYNWKSMFKLAMDSITSATTVPLKLATRLGMFSALVGFFAIIYTVLSKFLWQTSAGWASIMAALLFMGGVQLMFLGVIGEYIGRIFLEVKDRPVYIVHRFAKPQNAEQNIAHTKLGGMHAKNENNDTFKYER